MKPTLSALMLSIALAGAPLAIAAPSGPGPSAGGPQGQPSMPAGKGEGPRAGHPPRHGQRMMPREKPESFTEESVRKMADGRVFKRQVEQKVTEGNFYRKETMTNPEGKTASRTVTATFDKDKKTWTRKVEGVDFDGSTWSRTKDAPAPHDMGEDDEAGAEAAAPRQPQPRKAK